MFTFRSLIFCLLCALSLQHVSAKPLTSPLPIETFTRHGDYLDVVISPDGKHLATRMRKEEKVMLLIVSATDGQVVGGVNPSGEDVVHSVTWVNNHRVVYELAEKNLGYDRPTATGELFGINIDNTQSGLLYGYRAGINNHVGSLIKTSESVKASQEVLDILPADEDHILIIEYPWEKIGRYYYDNRKTTAIVSKLNIYTGRKYRVEALPYPKVKAITNQNGEVRFITWTDIDGDLHSAVKQDEEWKPINIDYPFAGTPAVIGLSHDEQFAFLYGAYGEKMLNNVFKLNLTSGAVDLIFEGAETDIEKWTFDEASGTPAVGIAYPGKPQYFYNDADETSDVVKLYKMLLNAFKGREIDIRDFSDDGRIAVVRVSSDINPGEFYLFNTQTKKADFIWANGSWIDINAMRPMQALQLEARDGTDLHAYLTLPNLPADKAAKAPLIVMPHGGPHFVRDYWTFDPDAQLFANRGYAVLQVNFRGSDGYGDAFESAGFGEWGGAMIDDILDTTQHVISTQPIDGARVCIYGVSYGGYAALMSAVKAPELFKCTIGSAGVYNLKELFEEGLNLKHFGGREFLERALGTDITELDGYSPIYHADKIQAKVMLIHGLKDEVALPEHAEQMRDALKRQGKKVRWLTFNKTGHGIYDTEDRTAMFEEILDFLDDTIGSPSR